MRPNTALSLHSKQAALEMGLCAGTEVSPLKHIQSRDLHNIQLCHSQSKSVLTNQKLRVTDALNIMCALLQGSCPLISSSCRIACRTVDRAKPCLSHTLLASINTQDTRPLTQEFSEPCATVSSSSNATADHTRRWAMWPASLEGSSLRPLNWARTQVITVIGRLHSYQRSKASSRSRASDDLRKTEQCQ